MIFVADHPILDLLNTVYRVPEGIVDALQTDADVIAWSRKAGLPLAGTQGFIEGELMFAARNLREVLRSAISQKVDGKPVRFAPLNAILAKASSHLVVRESTVLRRYDTQTAPQALAPLAELGAEFLTATDFSLVRRCQGKDCVLWFYDRTKSHRRRWCSMATCGNRAKVAAFRSR